MVDILQFCLPNALALKNLSVVFCVCVVLAMEPRSCTCWANALQWSCIPSHLEYLDEVLSSSHFSNNALPL